MALGRWYRHYVLAVLVAAVAHNLFTRNLPSYLVAVQVPGCVHACAGVATEPLCHAASLHPHNRGMTFEERQSFISCQLCRAQQWPMRREGERGGQPHGAAFFNLTDGACLTSWQYGLLVGYGFATIFAIGCLPAGYICDQKPRKLVVSTALAVWSLATALQSIAHSFRHLLMCRIVLGLAEAFAMPASISLAADYFRDAESTAVAVLSSGLCLGAGGASLAIAMAEALGWRVACLLSGVVGVFLSMLVYVTVKEPQKEHYLVEKDIKEVIEEVTTRSRVARLLIVAGSLKLFALACLSAFLPLWYFRAGLAGYTPSSYAVWNALIVGCGGLLSAVAGGRMSDVLCREDARSPCWVSTGGALLSLPLLVAVVEARTMTTSLSFLFAATLCSECWFGPTIALLQASVRGSIRIQAVALFLCVSTLFANLGPTLLGVVDPGDEELSLLLILCCIAANCCAALVFTLAAREVAIDPVAADLCRKGDDEVRRLVPERTGNTHWGII